MTPSRIWSGPILRSAIANSDQPFPRSCIAATTSRPHPGMSGSRNETLKNHLVGIACRARALLRCAHGPGQQRAAEYVARDPGRGRRQLVDPEGYEVWLGAKAMAPVQHAVALLRRQLVPGLIVVIALGDDAARQLWHDLAQRQHLIRIEGHADDGPRIA